MSQPPDTDSATLALAALADPTRRALYDVLRRKGHALGRDDVAELTGLARATAAFHLDRLVDVGVLEVRFERRSGRTGPGAGRPAKLYALAHDELTASVPSRQYELAGDLLAAAVEYSDREGVPVRDALVTTAEDRGHALGSGGVPLVETLAGIGYAPVACDDGGFRLTNCPFHHLAARHTDLICTANTAFVRGLTDESSESRDVWLEPTAGECCVRIGEERS
jgi:predicted ArsR family transcriptional regulator